MRHDEERPRTSEFLSGATVPGHWTQVLGGMRANPFTRLSPAEVHVEAAHLLILSPSPEVAQACFAELLGDFGASVEIATLEELVPGRVPAGTWVFLPHRQDGWTELEETSGRLRAALVKENSSRGPADKLVLIEYGINLWLWAEPPSSGGDPVCHAGELISWESAWALEAATGQGADRRTGNSTGDSTGNSTGDRVGDRTEDSPGDSPEDSPDEGSDSAEPEASQTASGRPPIYFGLPPILRKRRWEG